MSDKDQDDDVRERGGLSNLLDPKILPIFIPLIIAAFGAFLLHDRTIASLEERVSIHDTSIKQHNEVLSNIMTQISNLLSRVAAIKETQTHLKDESKTLENLERELQALVRTATQRIAWSDKRLEDITGRLRSLERHVDKLEGSNR